MDDCFNYAAIDNYKIYLFFGNKEYRVLDSNTYELISSNSSGLVENFYLEGFSRTFFYQDKIFYLSGNIYSPALFDFELNESIVYEEEGKAVYEKLKSEYLCDVVFTDYKFISNPFVIMFGFKLKDCDKTRYGIATFDMATQEIEYFELNIPVEQIIINNE